MPRTIITPTKVCIFEPAALPADPNEPFLDPTNNVRSIIFDGRFGYYSVAYAEDTTINHGAIAADPGTTTALVVPVPGVGNMVVFSLTSYNSRVAGSAVIANHNLDYVPHYKVFDEFGAMMSPGRPILQVTSGGFTGYETVRFRATTTQIIVDVIATPGKNGLPAISKTYHVRCFQPVGPVAGAPGFLARPSRVQMAQGAVDSSRTFLRTALSGEAHSVKPFGRASDANNGQFRFITADGTTFDTNSVIGAANDPYAGSFAGPGLLDVVV